MLNFIAGVIVTLLVVAQVAGGFYLLDTDQKYIGILQQVILPTVLTIILGLVGFAMGRINPGKLKPATEGDITALHIVIVGGSSLMAAITFGVYYVYGLPTALIAIYIWAGLYVAGGMITAAIWLQQWRSDNPYPFQERS